MVEEFMENLDVLTEYNKYIVIRNSIVESINNSLADNSDTDIRTILLAINEVLIKISSEEKDQSDNFSNKVRFILSSIGKEDEQHPHNFSGFKSLMETSEGYNFP